MAEQRKSVGVVLYRKAKDGPKAGREYLLLHYAAGHWDFPKGGQEKAEDDEQTLRRELQEETGITQVDVVSGFTHELSYFFREQGQLIRKTVVFYAGRTTQADVKLSFEHKDYAWLSFNEAKAKLTHKNAKEMLQKADEFLTRRAGWESHAYPKPAMKT